MHFNSVILDSDLKIVKGQKKVVYEPKVKIASMTCKSIAKWRIWWVLEGATNQELWGALEKKRGNSTPIILYDLVIWIEF